MGATERFPSIGQQIYCGGYITEKPAEFFYTSLILLRDLHRYNIFIFYTRSTIKYRFQGSFTCFRDILKSILNRIRSDE